MACKECIMKSSEYFHKLKGSVQIRYKEKTLNLLKYDPYTCKSCVHCRWRKCQESERLPILTLFNIYKYLVLEKSVYTHEQLNAYKSLEAYDYFRLGWVKEVK